MLQGASGIGRELYGENGVDFFDRLKSVAANEWASYVDHSFVRQLGDGSLPLAAFQRYLVQDYLFLLQYARACALMAAKSRTLPDLRAAQAALSTILDETDLHIRMCAAWGLNREQLESTPEHRATVAYTRFVLDCGYSGDVLDLQVALAPCVIGYAEIGARLVAQKGFSLDGHPYREWIATYADPGFQAAAVAARTNLCHLAETLLTERRFPEVSRIFTQAASLEADFWQAALDAAS